jgi:AcrR family transcriptional regulator
MIRTRKLLQGALSTLLKTKSPGEISVRDITEAATVNRATFYDHYRDKHALLDAMRAKPPWSTWGYGEDREALPF